MRAIMSLFKAIFRPESDLDDDGFYHPEPVAETPLIYAVHPRFGDFYIMEETDSSITLRAPRLLERWTPEYYRQNVASVAEFLLMECNLSVQSIGSSDPIFVCFKL